MTSVSPSDPLVTALADRYRIVRELGAGGMATVYLAEDVKHGRQVALKVLRDDLTASLGKERFLREISIAAALTHPHILALYDSGEAAGRLFYVMPYVEGLSLRQRLTRTGELPIGEAVRALRDIADAMAYAHKRNVVHRDLKPENVMLSERHALVTDFGVAKALSAATGRQVLTTLGVALGTPTYMSPEQATADPQLDHRSDIYSFGVMAYELLTGHTPFEGGTPQEVLARHVTTAAAPITGHRASIPPALAALVMRCLEKKPADRWQSAEEMLPQLEALLTPSGGITPHGTAPYSAVGAGGSTGWRRGMFIGAGLVMAALVGMVAYRKLGSSSQAAMSGANSSAGAPVWLAVLPPQNVGRPDDDAVVDGLADEIRGALARIPGAQVKGSRSSQSFKGSTKSIPEIARTLDVPWVVTSTVRWAPAGSGSGRLHVTVELVDARTEAVKWRSAYDTTLSDLYNGQGAVASRAARDIADALSLTGRSSAAEGVAPLPTVKPEAYAAYLSGRAALNTFSDEGSARAKEFFRRAVKLDPDFAKAQAWLAWSLWWAGKSRADTVEMVAASQRAAALAPDDPDVRVTRGFLRSDAWDWQGARSDFLAVLAKNPQDGNALWGLSSIEAALGNNDRAVELGRRAATVDPVTSGDILPMVLRMTGRLDESLAAARAGLAVDSLSTANLWWGGVAFVMAYRGEVLGYLHAEERQNATGRSVEMGLEAAALARAGRTEEAHAAIARMKRTNRPSVAFGIARAYASLGEPDSAFAWLDRHVGAHGNAPAVATDAFLAPLRQDPRYTALLKRVGLR